MTGACVAESTIRMHTADFVGNLRKGRTISSCVAHRFTACPSVNSKEGEDVARVGIAMYCREYEYHCYTVKCIVPYKVFRRRSLMEDEYNHSQVWEMTLGFPGWLNTRALLLFATDHSSTRKESSKLDRVSLFTSHPSIRARAFQVSQMLFGFEWSNTVINA